MSKAIEDALATELEALQAFRKPVDVLRALNDARGHWLAFERQAMRAYEQAVARDAREIDGPSHSGVPPKGPGPPRKAKA